MKSCLNVLLIFNLILIIYSFTIIDQRIFTKNDKYEYIIKDNNILTKFSFSFFFRFKTFFTFPAMLTETSIISISKSDPSIKTSFAFKTDSTNISILLRSSQNIIFEEFLPSLTNTLSDWFFIGISCNETDIFWYILDSTKRVIYSKKELKKPSLSINFNDKVTINPDGYFFFPIEFASIAYEFKEVDYYDINSSNKFWNYPPLDCDGDCQDCNRKTGECSICRQSGIQGVVCPMAYIQILDYKYYMNEATSVGFNVKSMINNTIPRLNVQAYSFSLWIKKLFKKGNDDKTEEVFSIYFEGFESSSTTKSIYPMKYIKDNNGNNFFLNLNKDFKLVNNMSNFDTWYMVVISVNYPTSEVIMTNSSPCDLNLLSTNKLKFTSSLDSLNELTSIMIANRNTDSAPFYGIISDFRVYYNRYYIYNKGKNSIFPATTFYNAKIICRNGIFCGDQVNFGLYHNRESKCQVSKYFDFTSFTFSAEISMNNLPEYTVDFWVYAKDNKYTVNQSIDLKVIWINHLVISLKFNSSKFSISCDPNQQFYNELSDSFAFDMDSQFDSWVYYRCSVSLTLLRYIQKINDLLKYNVRKFIVPRGVSNAVTSTLQIENKSNYFAGNVYIREIKVFRTFIDYLDFRYSIFYKTDFSSLIAYFPFDEVTANFSVKERSGSSVKLYTLNPLTNYSGDVTLPSEFTDLKLCEVNYYLNTLANDCFAISSTEKISNCDIMTSYGGCLRCAVGYYILSQPSTRDKCLDVCWDGYFKDDKSRTCKPCNVNCLKCIDESNCVTCKYPDTLPSNCENRCKFLLTIVLTYYNNPNFSFDFPIINGSSQSSYYLDLYIWIPSLYISRSVTYIDFFPVNISYLVNSGMAILYAKQTTITDLNSYSILLSPFEFKLNQWMRVVISNDINSVNPVSMFINGVQIQNIQKPLSKLVTDRLKFGKPSLYYGLAYYRHIRIWKFTQESTSIMNFYEEYKNTVSFPIEKLILYYKLDEGRNGSLSLNVDDYTGGKVNLSLDSYFLNYFWTSLDNCGEKKYFYNDACKDCPSNCLSCGISQNVLTCFLCKENFILKNNQCLNSSGKAFSLMNKKLAGLTIFDNSSLILNEFTVMLMFKILDYNVNNFSNKIINFSNVKLSLEAFSNLIVNYNKTWNIAYNIESRLGYWDIFAFNWENVSSLTSVYLLGYKGKANIVSFTGSNTVNKIILNENSPVLVNGLQIFSKKYNTDEMISLSFKYLMFKTRPIANINLIYYFMYNIEKKSFEDKIGNYPITNLPEYLFDIEEEMSCPDNYNFIYTEYLCKSIYIIKQLVLTLCVIHVQQTFLNV